METIKTYTGPFTQETVDEISNHALETDTEDPSAIPSLCINGTEGYDIFWLDDHPNLISTWETIEIRTYTESELNNL